MDSASSLAIAGDIVYIGEKEYAMNIHHSKWIRMQGSGPETVPVFRRDFTCSAPIARAIIAPVPDARLGRLSAKIHTPCGEISCAWRHTDGRVRYDVTTCVDTEIRIEGKTYHVGKGSYMF